MDPSYETVVDTTGMVWTLVPYLAHGLAAAAQIALAGFLVLTAAGALAKQPENLPILLRRVGMQARSQIVPGLAMLRFVLGLALLLPFGVGAPATVSALAAAGALALIFLSQRSLARAGSTTDGVAAGRWARRSAMACGLFALAMIGYEREDNVALGIDLVTNAARFREEELSWQLETDRRAPKVGDFAPDFELQDPEGKVRVRLSDFRGKRPVALVFGSYT